MIADITAIVATVLAVVSLIPQILKLHRTGNADGVSATWGAIGAVSNVGWFTYLVREELWASVPAPVLVGAFYAITVYYVGRSGESLQVPTRLSAIWAVALAATPAIGGWTFLGIVLGSSVVIQVAPGVWTAYRTHVPQGISSGTWTLILVEAVLWGYYGWHYRDAGILIFAAATVSASVLILARYAATRHRWADETASTGAVSG